MGILKKNDAAKVETNEAVVAGLMAADPVFESEAEGAAVNQPESQVEAAGSQEAAAAPAEAKAEEKPAAEPKPEVKAEEKAAAEPKPEPKAEEKPAAKPEAASDAKMPSVLKLGTHVLAKAGASANPFPALKDALKNSGIEYDYSTFPRYRNEAGVFTSGDDVEAGTYFELQVISYSSYWVVSPGSDDKSEKTKKAVRYSNDGKTINSIGEEDAYAGMTCDEYLNVLKSDMGYENASTKEYLEVFGFMLDAERADCKDLNTVVSLSLSPQSKSKFASFQTNRMFLVKTGRVKNLSANPVVRFTSVRQKGQDRTYYLSQAEEGKSAPINFNDE